MRRAPRFRLHPLPMHPPRRPPLRLPWPHLLALGLTLLVLAPPTAVSQAMPDGIDAVPWTCPERDRDRPPEDGDGEVHLAAVEATPEQLAERARRAEYRRVFPAYVEALAPEPDDALLLPVVGARRAQIADTWGAARGGGRNHEGQDIFAPQGTAVLSATEGYVWRIGERVRGGRTVTVIGAGGRRYYYAHLSAYADIREGQRVDPETVLGYVGTTGNAAATPPHLHFGAYESWEDGEPCGWEALDPLPLLTDR